MGSVVQYRSAHQKGPLYFHQRRCSQAIYAAIGGGSDVEDLLKQFDDIKSPHSKVEKIYTYLNHPKTDINESIIQHSPKIQELTPRRKVCQNGWNFLYQRDLKPIRNRFNPCRRISSIRH